MNKITSRQLMLLTFIFLLSNTLMQGYSRISGTGGFITLLIGGIVGIINCLLIARAIKLYPDMGFFEFLEAVTGKAVSRIIALITALYGLFLSVSYSGYMMYFVESKESSEGIFYPFVILLALCVFLIALSKYKTVGRFTGLCAPIIILMLMLCCLTAILKPGEQELNFVIDESFFKGALYYALIPFSSYFFIAPYIFACQGTRRKTLIIPTIISALLLAWGQYFNCKMLGYATIDKADFPAYLALSVLDISPFFQRIEIIIFVVFILCEVIRVGICGGFFVYAMEFVLNKKLKPIYSAFFTLTVTVLALKFRKNIDSFLTPSSFEYILAVIILGVMPTAVIVVSILKKVKKDDKIAK